MQIHRTPPALICITLLLSFAPAALHAQAAASSLPEPAQRASGPGQPHFVVPDDVMKLPYMNPALPTDKRVDDLLHRMTLEEKASQLVNQSRGIQRLGVPPYDWWSEALHGVASGIATVFPQPIGLAASFDAPMIKAMGVDISTEARAKYNMALRKDERKIFEGIDFWSPNLNIFRDPRWGRGQETYGEDPYLTGRMGVAFITGMQGDDPKYFRVISTPKHFAVHSGPEPSRHEFDVPVSKHDEEDTYLPAFRAAIIEGHAGSIMCVYNSVNGQPGCANDFLLKDTLRGKWGFQGYVVSDCDAVADIERGHHYVHTTAQAAAVSLRAGTDNDCADFSLIADPNDHNDFQRYIDAVHQGYLTEAELDTSLRRLLSARFRLGMFDPVTMVTYAQTPDSANDSPEHRELAHQLARETMVMLKNDGTLPLNSAIKNILVVGPLADSTRVLEGNYHGTASRYTTALEGIRQQFPTAHITFEPGTTFLRKPAAKPDEKFDTKPTSAAGPKGDTDAVDRAIAAAKSADVIIGIVGITSDLEGEEMKVDVPGFLGGDRTSLDLPQPEEQLMEYMHASGKPLVAVLMNGSALSINWLSTHANAILDAWYPGEEGGAAIAETLSGANNPAGKLPVTFYTGTDQLPDFTNYAMDSRTYRYFTGTPLYPFGYGLSYSKFNFTNLKLSQPTLKAGAPLEVSVDVTNTSGPDGDEVVELYITPPQTLGNPLHALRAFQRIHIAKGATEPVKLSLSPRDLSFVDLDGDRYIHAGTYQITAGDGQPQAAAASTTQTTLTIHGNEKLPE